MSLLELGRREQSSFPSAPLNFAQLHPDLRLPRKWRHKIPKDLELKDHPLRFLIKVREGIEMDALLHAMQESFGASATARKKTRRIVDDLRLKPLATIPYAKSSWWLLELPVLLGPFLSDTRFDLKQLQGLAKQLTAIHF